MEDLKKGDLLYEDKYKVDKVLGSGGYGKVYLVVDKKYNKLALNSFIFHIYKFIFTNQKRAKSSIDQVRVHQRL